MIDTHAHLTSQFFEKIEKIDLDWVILSASSMEDSMENIKLAKKHNNLLPSIGVHPQEKEFNKDRLEELLKSNPQIVAIGECGLEFVDNCDKVFQERIFREQIDLAIKYQKPIIIHSREASDEMLEILKDYKNLEGVIHCYTGGKKRIKKYLDLPGRFYFGIDGNITYEVGLEQVVLEIPKDRLVAETDTPFLTPVPFRGQSNKPENVKYVYQKIGEIWGEEAEKTLDKNAKRLFKIV